MTLSAPAIALQGIGFGARQTALQGFALIAPPQDGTKFAGFSTSYSRERPTKHDDEEVLVLFMQ